MRSSIVEVLDALTSIIPGQTTEKVSRFRWLFAVNLHHVPELELADETVTIADTGADDVELELPFLPPQPEKVKSMMTEAIKTAVNLCCQLGIKKS